MVESLFMLLSIRLRNHWKHMDNFAKSCTDAGIREGLKSIKFEPYLLVLGDIQKRVAKKDPGK